MGGHYRTLVATAALFATSLANAADSTSPAVPSPLPALSVYGSLPAVEAMSISPDGKSYAVIARIGGVRQIMLISAASGPKTRIPIGEAKLRGIRWASPTLALVTVSTTQVLGMDFVQDKIELVGVIRLSLDGQKPEMIFAKDSSIAHAVWGDYGSRTFEGKVVGYFGGIEFKRATGGGGYEFDNGRPALFQVDLVENRQRRVSNAPSEGSDRDWLIGNGEEIAAVLDIVTTSGAWKIANARGATIASGKNLGGKVALIALGKDGTTLIYSEQAEAEATARWFELPLAGGTAHEILADVDIERVFVDPTNGRLLGYLDKTSSKPVLFDPLRQARITQVYRAFPKSDLAIIEWTPDFGKFLVHTSGNGDSGTWYTIDMAAKRADPIGNDYPDLLPERLGAISLLAYKATDGMELDGILTLPPGRQARKLPVVMLPHGGPHAQDKIQFDWWAQAFASRGYAVFQPNFRGSTNRDGTFRRAGYGQWGRKMQTDVSDGLAELARQGIVDPKRACIVGASYGGYAALAGVVLQQGLYRCAVSVAGVSDLSDMYWTDYRESGENRMLKRNLNESLGPPSTFAEVSPRKHARDANAPILLIHGKDDTVVPFKQSTAMQDALHDAGKPVEFVTLREEDHWLSRSSTRQQMLEAAVAFVQKYNPAN